MCVWEEGGGGGVQSDLNVAAIQPTTIGDREWLNLLVY